MCDLLSCRRTVLGTAVLLLAWGAAACEQPAGPLPERQQAVLGTSPGPTLVECPTDTSRSVTVTLTDLGGSITLGDHRIDVPVGALLGPVTLTFTEPASQYMEVSIRALGFASFDFLLPITVALSYGRCTDPEIDDSELEVWYIDSSTKALLENMGGVDDRATRTYTFQTGHLSLYAFAH